MLKKIILHGLLPAIVISQQRVTKGNSLALAADPSSLSQTSAQEGQVTDWVLQGLQAWLRSCSVGMEVLESKHLQLHDCVGVYLPKQPSIVFFFLFYKISAL